MLLDGRPDDLPAASARRPAALLVLDPRQPQAVPNRVLIGLLTTELAVATTAILGSDITARPAGLGTAVLLTLLGAATTEITASRARHRPPHLRPPLADLTIVWNMAGALLLPPLLVAGLTTALHRQARLRDTPATATPTPQSNRVWALTRPVLAGLAAHTTQAAVAPAPTSPPTAGAAAALTIALAVLAYLGVDHALGRVAHRCTTARRATDPHTAPLNPEAGLLADADIRPAVSPDRLLRLAAACLGALTAAALPAHPLLVLLVPPAVVGLHHAAFARLLEQAVRVDAKTGVLTSAAWRSRAHQALAHRDPGTDPWALLIIDIDRFKTINDTHGHLAGDAVLAAIGAALRAEVRHRDLVGRFGGDEFLILLTGPDQHPNAGCGDAFLTAVADRIRRRVHQLRIELPYDTTITGLSVSVGMAVIATPGPDLPALLQQADTCLFAAKHAGRDTVRATTSPPTSPEPDNSAASSGPPQLHPVRCRPATNRPGGTRG